MKNKDIKEKYKKAAHFLAIAMKAFYVTSIIVSVLGLLAAILITLVPSRNSLFSPLNNSSFTLAGIVKINLEPNNVRSVDIKSILQTIIFISSILSIILIPIFKQLYLILESIKLNSPFVAENAKRLSIIGLTLVIASFVTRIGESCIAFKIVDVLNLSNIDINFFPNIYMLLTGFLILLLGSVFKYGSFLQEEYNSIV